MTKEVSEKELGLLGARFRVINRIFLTRAFITIVIVATILLIFFKGYSNTKIILAILALVLIFLIRFGGIHLVKKTATKHVQTKRAKGENPYLKPKSMGVLWAILTFIIGFSLYVKFFPEISSVIIIPLLFLLGVLGFFLGKRIQKNYLKKVE